MRYAYALALCFMAGSAGAQKATYVPKPIPAFIVTEMVKHNIDFYYYTVMERAGLEGSLCLIGIDKETDTLRINSLQLMWIDSASKGSLYLHTGDCVQENGALGMTHFHPPGSLCELSDKDILSAHDSEYPYEGLTCEDTAEGSLPYTLIFAKAEFDKAWVTLQGKEGKGVSAPGEPKSPIIYRYRSPP